MCVMNTLYYVMDFFIFSRSAQQTEREKRDDECSVFFITAICQQKFGTAK